MVKDAGIIEILKLKVKHTCE